MLVETNIIDIDLEKLNLIQEALETYLEYVQDEIESVTNYSKTLKESETILSSLLVKETKVSELLQSVDEALASHEE